MTARHRLACTVAAGIALGALLTLSSLLLVAIVLGYVVVVAVRWGLPANDRRIVTIIVLCAIAARLAVVMVLAVWSIPVASSQSGGVLFGDEGYLFERALRTRDLLLGAPVTKLDYVTVFDPYADTRYTWWLSWLQTTFGPSPYSTRLVNGVLFVAAAAVMYRLARIGFGAAAAHAALVLLLFLPSLLFWSVSLLKDSAFFLLTAGTFAAALIVARSRSSRVRVTAAGSLVAMLWALSDLRPGALVVTAGGLALGFAIRWALHNRVTIAAGIAIVVLACASILAVRPISTKVLEAITWLAQQHLGHATTPGHAYRTLDEPFYADWRGTLGGRPMPPEAAARFVGRSVREFLLAPLPWRSVTIGEVVFIPEQVTWYLVATLAVAGLGAAYRRDRLLTSLLVGYIAAMSAAVALTSGNVGTLVRLRGLVLRFAVWIAAVGAMAVITKLMRGRATP